LHTMQKDKESYVTPHNHLVFDIPRQTCCLGLTQH
jgi:hypothetical protein